MPKIEMPIEVFSKCSVIYIEFKFDDKEKAKRRPAIVIDFDQKSTRVILLKVTSQGVRTDYDYELTEPIVADLKEGSVVRCNHIMTVPNSYKCELHGMLSRKDAMAVEYLYNQALLESDLVES